MVSHKLLGVLINIMGIAAYPHKRNPDCQMVYLQNLNILPGSIMSTGFELFFSSMRALQENIQRLVLSPRS